MCTYSRPRICMVIYVYISVVFYMCVRRAHARLRVMFRDDVHRYTYMHAWIIDELQVRENDRVKAPMSGAK